MEQNKHSRLKRKNKKIYAKIKRILDVLFALLLLIIFAVPMIIVAVIVKLEDGGPAIYKSKRIGKDLKEFNLYKFRSMKMGRKELESNLSHEEMVTKVGKFIRRTSLDELPQIFNILKGEMSFIGPRPWIPEYYECFNDEQKRRVEVLPGLSGLAQINGRNGLNIFEKIECDLEYIENMSFRQDCKIFFETLKTLIIKENAEITEQGIKDELEFLRKGQKNKEKINEKVI